MTVSFTLDPFNVLVGTVTLMALILILLTIRVRRFIHTMQTELVFAKRANLDLQKRVTAIEMILRRTPEEAGIDKAIDGIDANVRKYRDQRGQCEYPLG